MATQPQPSPHPRDARVIQTTTAHSLRWISLHQIEWIDGHGVRRIWESSQRTTRQATATADAVSMYCILRRDGRDPSTLLVLQFRPPVGAISVEFPAGLIDVGESAGEAALRELREETGYVGVLKSVSPPISCDPGLTSATYHHCVVDVDLNDPVNQNPRQALEVGEAIEVVEVAIKELSQTLHEMSKKGYVIDSRLWSFAEGLGVLASL
jgi:ADP-ribose pyrophosphatase